MSEPGLRRAPFTFLIEVPGTIERIGIVAYFFTANTRETRNRPEDEARFQIKYGSKRDNSLHYLFDDPNRFWITLLWGVDVENGLVVSADPRVHSPTRFFVMFGYKHRHMSIIARDGWAAWSRDRRDRSSKGVIIPEEQSAATETLVGADQRHVLDLLLFEREAYGLEAPYRHALADKVQASGFDWCKRKSDTKHALLKILEVSSTELLDIISRSLRLRMAIFGWVAQHHLQLYLEKLPLLKSVEAIERDGQPDFSVELRETSARGNRLLIECKNASRELTRGHQKVDFQRTRAPQGNPCGRFYAPTEFHILAACLQPRTGKWEFRFKATARMTEHPRCPGRLSPNVLVDASWTDDLAAAIATL